MKITRLETLRLAEFPNLVWPRVHTDAGVEQVAPRVLGALPGYLGWRGSGIETRAASAFDIAPLRRKDAVIRVSTA